jgi:hypothetical protein
MSDAEVDQIMAIEPDWPDLHPLGLVVTRSSVAPRTEERAKGLATDEHELKWILHLGVAKSKPRLALLGDLTARTERDFAGVMIAMPFVLRDEPDELTTEFRDQVLRRFGPWASSFLYDYAAAALRSAVAGYGLTTSFDIPNATPDPVLHTSDVHRARRETAKAAANQPD